VPEIVIIGAGFCGTMTSVHLLHRLSKHPGRAQSFRLTLIERAPRFARGVAYGTQHPLHLLNVPAAKMTALPDEPDHFLKWSGAHLPNVTPYTFAPRRLYGQYLTHLLNDAVANAPHGSFQRIDDEALALDVSAQRSSSVIFKSHPPVSADAIVLAPGNYPPADLPIPGASGFYSTNGYIRDPWAGDVLSQINPAHDILLIGTGLTMVDVVVQLNAQGHTGRIRAVSRHGLLPRPHADDPIPPAAPPDSAANSPRKILHALRQGIRENHLDYRGVIDALRPATCNIWQGWSDNRKRQFLRHARAYWEVHRHRIAPQIAKTIAGLLATQRVDVSAGRILAFRHREGGVDISIHQRGGASQKNIRVDKVINCTGPDTDIRRSPEPLLKNLLQQGLIRPDSLGLGLDTHASGAVISRDGNPSKFLFTIGSTCKGRLWECTAVPELRQHAADMAETLLNRVCRE
jgi:uncharacterized NAD(P)/FAD-binding protein YdhS